jgi:hypothetical protein
VRHAKDGRSREKVEKKTETAVLEIFKSTAHTFGVLIFRLRLVPFSAKHSMPGLPRAGTAFSSSKDTHPHARTTLHFHIFFNDTFLS